MNVCKPAKVKGGSSRQKLPLRMKEYGRRSEGADRDNRRISRLGECPSREEGFQEMERVAKDWIWLGRMHWRP